MNLSFLFKKIQNGSYFNGFLLAITQSVIALLFIFIDYFFSKQLSLVQFGYWKEMYFMINISIPILSLGIPEGYKYYIAKDGNISGFFSNTFLAYISIAIIALMLIIVLNLFHVYNLLDLKEYYLISLAVPIAYLSYVLNQALRYTYINNGWVQKHTRITLVCFVFTLFIVGISYYYFSAIKLYYLELGIALYVFAFGFPIITLIKQAGLKIDLKCFNKRDLYGILQQGIPLYMATFIGLICINIDKGIVSIFEDKAKFAVFSVGALEIPIFAMLSAAFSQNVYPKLVKFINENKKEEAKTLWLETTKKVSYLTYPLLILLMIFSKELIYFIYSTAYQESIILFQTYLLVGLFRNNYYGALIAASGQTKYITYYSIALLIFNIVLSLGLYFSMGLKGIVWGNVIATMIMMILQLRHEGLLKRYLKEFLFDKVVFILIIIIVVSYIYA